MILDCSPNVNPDWYCYESKLSFGEEFCRKLLDQILSDFDYLPKRSTYLDPIKDIEKILEQLSFSDQKNFMRRMNQYKNVYSGLTPTEFLQYGLTPELEEEFKNLIPAWLTIDTGEIPRIAVQVSKGGEYMAPHEDPKRSCGLFMLLQGNEETHWHRITGDFKTFSFFNVPDLEKIETIVKAMLTPFKWTVFNHKACHSVHNFSKTNARISIQIEFDNISSEQLVNLVKKYESNTNA